ncbi:hypothetical protein PQR71_35305 [Paraburkholderia fungorum]
MIPGLLEDAPSLAQNWPEAYREHGGRHHALHDARANRYAANGYEEEGTA